MQDSDSNYPGTPENMHSHNLVCRNTIIGLVMVWIWPKQEEISINSMEPTVDTQVVYLQIPN